MSIVDQLERLKALFEDGVLSPQQYDQAKTALLSSQPQAAPAPDDDDDDDDDDDCDYEDEVTDAQGYTPPPPAPTPAPEEPPDEPTDPVVRKGSNARLFVAIAAGMGVFFIMALVGGGVLMSSGDDDNPAARKTTTANKKASAPDKPSAPAAPARKKLPNAVSAPANQPCRVATYDRFGLFNWWSYSYEDGQLTKGRDEDQGLRNAFAKMKPMSTVIQEMADKTWLISYEYDAKGRLVRYLRMPKGSSSGGQEFKFRYSPDGAIKGWSKRAWMHGKESEGSTKQARVVRSENGRPLEVKSQVGPLNVSIKYQYGTIPAALNAPFVYANGEIYFGQQADFISFKGKPHKPFNRYFFDGPDGMLSGSRLLDGGTTRVVFTYGQDNCNPLRPPR